MGSYLNPTAQVDYACGMALVQGILAALYERERFGGGQEVSVCLLDVAVAMQMMEAAARTMYGQELNWVTQWYNATFATTDGVITVLGLFRDNAVGVLCEALGIENLSRRPELATNELQARNKDVVNEVIAPVVAKLTTDDAMARLEGADLLCAPQLRLEDVLEHPQIAANDLMVDVEVAGHGWARVGNPIRLSRSPAAVRRQVPRLGQHTREVLAEGGYSPSEIDRLNSDRAVRLQQADPHQYAALFA